GDPRPSLEQRYGTNAGYKCIAQQATIIAAANGYLLPSDEETLLTDISGSNVLTSGYTPTPADTTLGNSLCANAALAATYYAGLNLGIDAYYALIDLGKTNLTWNSGPISGNVLLGQGLNAQLAGGNGAGASGTLQYDPSTTINVSQQSPIKPLPVPTSVTSAALTAARDVSNYAASLPATQTFGNINNAEIIQGNGGLNVINVANIRNAPLTLSGTASDIFVINVSGGIKTNQPMTLLGGVSPSHVLFNLTGNSGNILQASAGNALYGTYLATNGGHFNFSQLNLTGAVINIGGNVQFVGQSQIQASAPFMPFQLPGIVSVF
ncbi:MAG: hypothetical protein JO139_05350, partial [Alphaproteobacteria bacterium]|nr:hypothetical protein [Alphaproteobacteria bacterium]